jgi:hypothetical protein
MSLKKDEGVVFSPVPMAPPVAEKRERRLYLSPHPADPRCEMCGHPVIATHCKRICLHCGFMTGCSEGI